MIRSSLLALLMLATLLLIGCASDPIPQDNFYRFGQAPVPNRYETPVLDGRIFVERPRAIGERRGRAMLYSDFAEQTRLRKYHTHLWEEEPARMLRRRIATALTDAGLADAVAVDQRRPTDFLLRSEVARFEQLNGNGNPVALVELSVSLRRGLRGELMRRSYRQEIKAETSSMLATVDAFGVAVDNIIDELLGDLQGIGDLEDVAVR